MADEEPKLCDPCQIKDPGIPTVCGWQGRSLGPHLKSHKKTRAKDSPGWKLAEYKKKFPTFSVGEPNYKPTQEDIDRFRSARGRPAPTKEDTVAADIDAIINAKFEELWLLCERDPAARVFCLAAARDEQILEDDYKRLRDAKRSLEYEKVKAINQAIEMTSVRLRSNYQSLSLTVEQRRKSNQLGNDTVSQLAGNFANTLRKMSPEKQDAFLRRMATVEASIKERVRVKHLDEIILNDDEQIGAVTDDDDYRRLISKISAAN